MKSVINYFYNIKTDKTIIWCYLIWYLVTVYFYFDPTVKLWANALGVSAVIGTGLFLSVSSAEGEPKDHWQTFRLYLMPFCVSSFSALIKDRGFVIFISPKLAENLVAICCCLGFLSIVWIVKLGKNTLKVPSK